MKTCSVCRKKFSAKAGLKQHMDSVHSQKGMNSGQKGMVPAGFITRQTQAMRAMGNSMGDGTITLQRSELIKSVEVANNSNTSDGYIKLLPTASVLPWLYKLASSFDQIVWHQARVIYKPAIGTTFGGSFVIGVDWNPAATTSSRSTVQACSPVAETAVWQPSQIVLPASRLQSRKYYFMSASQAQDAAPAAILYNLKCSSVAEQTFIGDIWLEYKVSLLGPSA